MFQGFFGVDDATLRYEKPDGTMSDVTSRLCVERGDAAGVVVFNTDSQKLILVRQFRYPCLRHGDGWPIEIVAGAIDPGETPEQAARREVEEEIGYRVKSLTKIGPFYGSPGGLSEVVHLFYAEVASHEVVHQGGGLEGEDVELVRVTRDEAFAMMDRGEIRDAKALIGLSWLRRQP